MIVRFRIALTTVAMLGASVAAAQEVSHAVDGIPLTAATEGATPQAATPPSESAGGVMVFIDPVTGKTRQPEAGEVEQLLQQRAPALPQSSLTSPSSTFNVPGGGVGLMLDDSFHSYMVVTRKPDGTMLMDCLPDGKAAADAVTNGLSTGEILHKKEALDVQ
jgi:hypothetical protein